MKKKAHRIKTILVSKNKVIEDFEYQLYLKVNKRKSTEPYTYESIITIEEYNNMIYADEKLKLIDDWKIKGLKVELFDKDFMKLLGMKIPAQSKIQAHKIMEQWNKSKSATE